jgi:hypothetical protein
MTYIIDKMCIASAKLVKQINPLQPLIRKFNLLLKPPYAPFQRI